MTVKQLLNSLDSREITEWLAYYEIEAERMKKDDPKKLSAQIKTDFGVWGGPKGKRR